MRRIRSGKALRRAAWPLGVGATALLLTSCSSGSPSASSSTTGAGIRSLIPKSPTTSAPATTTTTPRSTTTAPPATTTTVPPTTTTAPPTTTTAPLPLFIPLTGQTPLYEPTEFTYTQDGTGSVQSISWSSWGPGGASGEGTEFVNDCNPDCAQGTSTPYFAFVTLSDPSQTADGYIFTQMTINAPASPTGSQTYSIPL